MASYACIHYRAGYKYQLAQDYCHRLGNGLAIDGRHDHDFFYLLNDALVIRAGYAWDGPSGPTIDTASFMRGALVHDVLYQAIQLRMLPPDVKDNADRELADICRQDGMSAIRAWWVYQGVKHFGGRWAMPGIKKKRLSAPR